MENKRWSPEQVEYLKKHYHITPIDDLMLHFNKTKMAVRWKASQLGLTQKQDQETQAEEVVELVKIEKGVHNMEVRYGANPPFIYLSIGGQIRFSTSFSIRFDLKGGEAFNFFTDRKTGKRVFFKFEDDGNFIVQVHDRRRSATSPKRAKDYISQSLGLRHAIVKAYPEYSSSAIKLVVSEYMPAQGAYELSPNIVTQRGRKKKKN